MLTCTGSIRNRKELSPELLHLKMLVFKLVTLLTVQTSQVYWSCGFQSVVLNAIDDITVVTSL